MKKSATAPKPAAAVKTSRRISPAPAKLQARDHADGNGQIEVNGDGVIEAQRLLEAMLAFRDGDFSVRLPAGWTGLYGKIADAFNDVLTMNDRRAAETARVSRVVG